MEFTTTETNTTRVAGLANGDASQTSSDIEFGIAARDDGQVEIVESGSCRVGPTVRIRPEIDSASRFAGAA